MTDLEPGTLILREIHDPGVEPQIELVRCDYRVWIADDLLDKIRAGKGDPSVEISGDRLTIHATNRDVRYLIGPPVDGDPPRHLMTRIELR